MSTTIPKHSILPVSSSDLPALAKFVAASKLPLAVNRFLFKDWPNESAQMALYTGAVESSFGNPDHEMLKVVENDSGNIVAHLVLTRKKAAKEEKSQPGPEPESVEEEGRAAEKPSLPEGLVPEFAALVGKAVGEVDEPMKGTEHLALTHIYVKPSSRKQGIGSSLIRLSVEKGKQAGIPVFVHSEPQARHLFLGLGFRDTGHFDMDLSKLAPENCGFGVFRLSGMVFEG